MNSQSSVADFMCDENYHKRYILEVNPCSDAAMMMLPWKNMDFLII